MAPFTENPLLFRIAHSKAVVKHESQVERTCSIPDITDKKCICVKTHYVKASPRSPRSQSAHEMPKELKVTFLTPLSVRNGEGEPVHLNQFRTYNVYRQRQVIPIYFFNGHGRLCTDATFRYFLVLVCSQKCRFWQLTN